MRAIKKEYTIYGYNDLKKDYDLCDRIYEKFWIDNPNNINPWADDNLDSFGLFANTLNMKLDYSLSNDEYATRQCYIKLVPDYYLDNKDYKELLKDYSGNGYYFCLDLADFTNNLLNQKKYKVLCEWSTDDFVLEIQNKMFELWFKDNQDYFSKDSFLDHIESNGYEFDEDGNLF